jgi:hypothetical protein
MRKEEKFIFGVASQNSLRTPALGDRGQNHMSVFLQINLFCFEISLRFPAKATYNVIKYKKSSLFGLIIINLFYCISKICHQQLISKRVFF